MKVPDNLPKLVVARKGALRLAAGHPWVYKSDVSSVESGAPPGALVAVADDRGRFLGSALYSSSSQIALRLISTEPVNNLPELVRERIRAAVAYRKNLVSGTNAYRLIFSEADQLPGLIADRFNDVMSVQVLTQAMDREEIRAAIIQTLQEQVPEAQNILERVDARIRQLEELPAKESGLLAGKKTSTVYEMNGLKFQFDGTSGQKTGAFLDQRENYAAAASYAHGEALDVCTYQGGFGLHLAASKKVSNVSAVDVSRATLEVADENGALNKDVIGKEIEWIEGNAFDLLKDYSSSGKQYDTIVLDPPAFAKSKKNLETATRGYKEMNLRALKMLRPGGILVTCSCSFHVSESEFLGVLASAAADSHRTLKILEKRGAAKDHPAVATIPETSYLKCIICTI
ncbi:MAG: class I SAM-dependent rRNA methyltransferase [Terriglobales bacterium]